MYLALFILLATAHANTEIAQLITERLSMPRSDDFHITNMVNSHHSLSDEGTLTLQANRLEGILRTEVNGFAITLEYDVKLDALTPGFLPGLFGGNDECGPLGYGKDCFIISPRFLQNGVGEVFAGIPDKPQLPSLCSAGEEAVSVPPKLGEIVSICRDTGVSLYRGTYQLQTDRWHHFKLSVQLNTIGEPDGILLLDVDQINVIYTRNLLYRESPDLILDGISFNLTTSGAGMQFRNIHIDYEIKEPFNSTFAPYSDVPVESCNEDEYRCEVEGGPFFFQCVDETFIKRTCGRGTQCHQIDSEIECVFP
ncbi:hypothetical protein K493DRAFT_317314 [Basidiobolus meristosporus CBS 931.73]|uniref:Polysaccharide lyase 14 domain-containing protein n=1 Tax=Basidiobolus meristosporus CBS 931.73 TaxID=1314790 RepID=A0A1Y1Y084_9FUNG|nr:hypothetical protein K493DRAFT_317314 [Basidiobolus meristosporus CBS 931.73]|eukprot:ORX91378.1 hypothetical protein K493DRAFT_317314 [Basidiobolus meristosporus CBS 931.73]